MESIKEVVDVANVVSGGDVNIGKFSRIRVEFENIKINTDYQLVEGMVETSYDPNWGNVGSVDEFISDIGELFNAIAELLSNYKGTEEEVSLLQELNQKQDAYIADLINSPYITTEAKNELIANQEVYKTVSNDLIAESTSENGYDTGSGMANQVIQRNNELQASIEKAEDEVFVGDAYTILSTDGVYQEVLEKIKTISEYLKESAELCREQGWGSYKDQGVFPYCLWKEAPIAEAFYYSKVDIPFVAGLTDGLYGEVEGLVLLPKMFYDLSTGMQEFIYAYTWAKWQCTPNKVAMNQKRMGLLLEKLEREQAETSIWSWVKEQWYEGQKELTEYEGKRCEDAEKLRNEVDEFVDFVQERENLKQLIADVEEKLTDYWNTVSETNNEARYHHGKIFIVVASSLVPVAVWVSKSTKVKKILEWIKKATPDDLLKLKRRFEDSARIIKNRLWTSIDEIYPSFFNGNSNATLYDINVTYQLNRPRAGVAFEEKGLLELHLNIPEQLQGQGVGTEIFIRAIKDYSPSKVKGWWKVKDIYTGGESINLTIFKQKLAEGLSPIEAALETPSGKIFKRNGFGGTPQIIKNTPEEVIIHFNPTN